MKKILAYSAAFALLLFGTSCQHGIDPDDLELPPNVDETQMTSTITPEEAEVLLKKIHQTPYPPYTVSAGDVFRVRVYNENDLNNNSSATTMVTPDGYLTIDLVGPVLVRDKTLIGATDAVKEALSKYIRHPKVSLAPATIIGKSATLLGAINEPGRYPVSENVRLSDFVAMGRGFATGSLHNDTVELADLGSSYVIRNDKILPINFSEAIVKGNQKYNIRIFPQDIVYIARREEVRVTVIGEVRNPTTVNWREGMTFLDALGYCGGLADDYWGTALIMRKPRHAAVDGQLDVYKININEVLRGESRNFRLASGDIVYVPKDSLGEYNVFIRKLMPTAQFINLLMSPVAYWKGGR